MGVSPAPVNRLGTMEPIGQPGWGRMPKLPWSPAPRLRLARLACMILLAAFFATGCGKDDDGKPEGSVVLQPPPQAPAGQTASAAGEIGVPTGYDAFGVMVFAEGTSLMALTDANGRFALSGLAEGKYQIRAMRADLESLAFEPLEVTATDLRKAQPFHKFLRVLMEQRSGITGAGLPPGSLGNLRGKVLGTGGDPSPGVVVSLEGTRHRTVTIATGEWELLNTEPGTYTVNYTLAGFEPLRRSATVTGGKETDLGEMRLGDGAAATAQDRTIYGRVDLLAADGTTVRDYTGVSVVLEGTSHSTTPDASGAFELRGIPAGRYIAAAAAPGYLLEKKFLLELDFVPAAEVTFSLVEDTTALATSGTLYGRVTLEDAESNAGIAVSLAGTSMIAFTDAAGEYVIYGITPGNYDMVAMFTGYLAATLNDVRVTTGDPILTEELTLEKSVTRPRVVYTSPANGAAGVAIRNPTTLTVQFSQPMRIDTVMAALSFAPEVGFTARAAGDAGRGAQDTVTIDLAAIPSASGASPLKYSTNYKLKIAKSAANAEGVEMAEDFDFAFTTGDAMVIGSSPADGDNEARLNFDQPLRFYFNAPIDRESIAADDIRFSPALAGSPNINFRNDPETGWTTLIVSGYAEPDKRYTVTIRRGADTITGSSVRNLPFSIRFKTRRLLDFDEVYGTGDPGYNPRERERQRR